MELKEFISETLQQLALGIKDGHNYIVDNELGRGVNEENQIRIHFDVALTVLEEEKEKLGGKVGVASILSAGGEIVNTSSNNKYSRIQFELFVNVKSK